MAKYGKIILAVLFTFMLALNSATAASNKIKQSESETVNAISKNMNFDSLNKKIEEIEKVIKKDNFSKEVIDSYVSYLSEQEANIVENKKELEKQIKFVQKQIDALGTEPKEGETEDKIITKQREDLSQEMAIENRILKEADLVVVKIEDLTAQVLNARNKKIYGNLITKQSALVNPKVLFNSIKLYGIFFWDVVKSPIVWYQDIPDNEKNYVISNIFSMILILITALTLAIFARRYILSNWGYRKDIELPRFGRKVFAAIAVATARGLIPASLIGGCLLWMTSSHIFEKSFLGYVLSTSAIFSLIAISEATISRVTFAPNYPQWRLFNISNEKAARFTRMIFFFIIFNSLANGQVYLANLAKYSIDTVHFLTMISCAIKAFFIMWFAKVCFETYKDFEIKKEEDTLEDEESSIDRGFKFIVFTNLFCIISFSFSLFGYPALSSFILNRVISTLIVVGVFELFRRAIV